MSRPNILWISLEDTSPRFGCYGDKVARTPHLDQLAAQGCRFPNAFSTAGVCAPSRSCIITGMYATSIGAHHMRTLQPPIPNRPGNYEAVIPHYAKLLPEYLRGAGYFCTNNAKTDYQFQPPFTAWDECDTSAHWRHRSDPDQPFFAVFNPTVTHESGMWEDDDPRMAQLAPWRTAQRKLTREGNESLHTDPDAVQLPPYLPDTPKARRALARHYDNIAKADARVGELLAQLEEDGLSENTIVVIWSDHGEGLPRAKRWPYDAGIRIPLIVRWPGHVEAATVNPKLVSLIDLAPTMLNIAGVAAPRHLQGADFLGAEPHREYVFAHRDRHDESYDMVRAARDERFKYIRHFCPEKPYLIYIPYRNCHPIMQELWRLHAADELTEPQKLLIADSRPPEELYDTRSDPFEIDNLAAQPEHRATLERMRAALDEWRATYGDKGEVPETEMVEQMWPGGQQPQTQTPQFVPIAEAEPGLSTNEGGTFDGPLLLQLVCDTQGASIGYSLESEGETKWQLYGGPLRLPLGQTTVRAKAIRVGYAESAESRATFVVA